MPFSDSPAVAIQCSLSGFEGFAPDNDDDDDDDDDETIVCYT